MPYTILQLDAPKLMFKEDDAMQRESLGKYEQLGVLCQQEVGIISVERFELGAHKARLDSVAADTTMQRRFDTQIVADAMEKQRAGPRRGTRK